jgi:pteridine reductase
MNSAAPLAQRTILVTGGAHRVGGDISRHLGRLGAKVLVHYHRSAGEAADLVASLPAGGAAFSANLADPGGPKRLLDLCAAAGEVPDTIVHSAASFLNRPFLATTAADWDAVQALNVRSFFLLAQELARRRGSSGGDLVAIGDAAALDLWTGFLAHSIAKAALIPLVKGLARILAPDFRVNGIIPGPVLPPEHTTPAELDRMRERTLLKRLGTPAHVSQAVEFLLRCDYVTGAWIEVTGGSQLWRAQLATAPTQPESPSDPAAAVPAVTAKTATGSWRIPVLPDGGVPPAPPAGDSDAPGQPGEGGLPQTVGGARPAAAPREEAPSRAPGGGAAPRTLPPNGPAPGENPPDGKTPAKKGS